MTKQLTWFQLPTAEPSESNAFETIERLTLLTKSNWILPNDNQTQAIPNTSILTNNNICNTPQNNMAQSHNQSIIILQQFSMITQELKNFTNKVSGDITKITQAYTTAQEKNRYRWVPLKPDFLGA